MGKFNASDRWFLALLKQVGVDLFVDVRSLSGSETNPQLNADALPDRSMVGIPASAGSWRAAAPEKVAPPSPNACWHVTDFRNYADYAETNASKPD